MKKHTIFTRTIQMAVILVCLGIVYKLFGNPTYVIRKNVEIDRIIISDLRGEYTETSTLQREIVIEDAETIDRLVSKLKRCNLKFHRTDEIDTDMTLCVTFYSKEEIITRIKLIDGSEDPRCRIYVYGEIQEQTCWLPGSFIKMLYEVIG